MSGRTIVVGLGNPLMADEGIGCRLVERLENEAGRFPGVRFVDAGTGGVRLLHLLADADTALLIDCAMMGAEPGAIRRFTPDQVESVKMLAHQSLHEADILGVIRMAEQLGQCPRRIVLFGIQPEKITCDRQLSPTLVDGMDRYLALIRQEIGPGADANAL